MKLGVISDTHAHYSNTCNAIRVLESLEVDEVIHCGDIGSREMLGLFTSWPTHFVLGNVDGDDDPWSEWIDEVERTFHGRFGSVEIGGRRIAFLHGDDDRRLREEIASQKWDLLCHGHTHIADQQQIGRTLVLNPGAMVRVRDPSVAYVDLETMEATHVSC
jgi:putative phosphoesterase